MTKLILTSIRTNDAFHAATESPTPTCQRGRSPPNQSRFGSTSGSTWSESDNLLNIL
jgi:hypothetical protein